MDNGVKKIAQAGEAMNEKSLVEFSFIKDKPHLVYLIKKVGRLSGAVHILTAELSPEEPMRRELRRSCLLLLDRAVFGRSQVGNEGFEALIANCVSLIDIARLSLILSDMNASILKQEFINLLGLIDRLREREKTEVSFDVSELSLDEEGLKEGTMVGESYKRHSTQANVLLKKNTSRNVLNKIKPSSYSIGQNNGRQNQTRAQMIMDIIKNKGEVSLKDIHAFIRGVSGKTIQRDLLSLVSDGVLKKSGERRWSKYSMANR